MPNLGATVMQHNAAARITLVDGESLEFRDGEAYLTLRLDGDAARWFAENLPRHDGITETFASIAARLEAVGA